MLTGQKSLKEVSVLVFSSKNSQHTTTPLQLILLVFCLLPGEERYDSGAVVGEGNEDGSSLSFHLPSA